MADELRLPEELAAFEALLAAKPLTAPGIDRDQVMYRAGWAACAAQWRPRAVPGPQGTHRRTAAWSCASAALAAALAVAVTLGWGRTERSELVELERAGGETPRLAGDETVATVVVNEERPFRAAAPALLNELDRYIDADARGRRPTLAGPWLTLHRLDQQPLHARHEHVADAAESTPAAPKTIRDLQHEMLPHAPAPPRFVWPWERTTSGDAI